MSRSEPADSTTSAGGEHAEPTFDDDVLATAQGAVGVVHETSAAVDEDLEEINTLATAQVERMVDVASDVSELSATIEEVASSAAEMSDRSEGAADAVTSGTDAAVDAAEAMDDVTEAIDAVAEDVERLVDSVEQIDEIVDVISSIADETNLLALNASIQAARAGEDGAGFGVVAGEIKSLAAESQERTDEVKTVVDGITEATETLSSRLESAVDIADTGAVRATDAEAELETVSEAVTDVAAGLQEVSNATDEGAAASERVAHRCEETASAAEKIDETLDAVEHKRYRQTDMVAEVDRALEVATASRRERMARKETVPTGFDAVGGFPEGCRGVLEVSAETPGRDAAEAVGSLAAAALECGYAVSLSPTESLDRQTVQRAVGRHGCDLGQAFDRDQLFVIDLFDTWRRGENVFDATSQSLGTINERIDRRRDRPLLVIGTIAGELHAFGEQATRENTYDNDGGILEATDTVVNVVDDAAVPPTLAQFYTSAADRVICVEPGPTLESARSL